MNTRSSFESVWRERLDPQRVAIPRSQYSDYVPRVDVSPVPVLDSRIMASDASLQRAIATAFGIVNQIVQGCDPIGVGIPMQQLLDQLVFVKPGRRGFLRVYSKGRVLKKIPLGPALVDQCVKIQRYLSARLLLFEDMAVNDTGRGRVEWLRAVHESPGFREHGFCAGAKADSVIRIADLLDADSRRTAIFVRNISVSEGICAMLSRAGMRAVFLHGDMAQSDRRRRLREFKNGDAGILVATRKLYGRGLDLPEADAAIFYSPKASARVMWQEMLRIRATVLQPKPVFILFYAWTAEASKLGRLIQGMHRTGAIWQSGWFRWIYAEPGVLEDEEPDQEPVETDRGPPDRESASRSFVRSLMDSVRMLCVESRETIIESLEKMAEHSGFLDVWPNQLVRSLVFQLSETIVYLGEKTDLSLKSTRRYLSKVFHPDKHLSAAGVEKAFWHELFVALGEVP